MPWFIRVPLILIAIANIALAVPNLASCPMPADSLLGFVGAGFLAGLLVAGEHGAALRRKQDHDRV